MNIDAIEQLVRSEHRCCDMPISERLHHFRLTFEPYIFHLLILRYGQKLEECWKMYQPTSRKAFVIVERRCHPNFWFVLRNLVWARPDMPIYIFCSDVNIDFLRGLIGNKDIHLLPVFIGSPGREQAVKEYSDFLTSPAMYKAIDADWIITIQMDVFIRRKIPDSIFMGEYWGYPFGWRPDYAGGGGASVRNVKKCYELCMKYADTGVLDVAEDVWFCERVTDIPSFDTRRNYIMENVLSMNPYIVHQFWTYVDVTYDFKKYWNYLLTFEIVE